MKQLSLIRKRKKTPGIKWGRPPSTYTGARRKRPLIPNKRPIHVTLRLRDGLPNLRTRKGQQLIRRAFHCAKSKGLRLQHFAVLSNHIHFIAECDDNNSLYRAMRGFCTSLGIGVRKWADRIPHLGVFRGRYHVQILNSARQYKNALKYVLLNPSRHFRKAPYIDIFTSASAFSDWSKLIERSLAPPSHSNWFEDLLSPPQFWIVQKGWLRL